MDGRVRCRLARLERDRGARARPVERGSSPGPGLRLVRGGDPGTQPAAACRVSRHGVALSGLLHRLAARAINRTAPLRVDGLPPYVAPAVPSAYTPDAAPTTPVVPSAAPRVVSATAPAAVVPAPLLTQASGPAPRAVPTRTDAPAGSRPSALNPSGEAESAGRARPDPAAGDPRAPLSPPRSIQPLG